MTEDPQPGMDIYRFIRDYIDTVPHLEALMLLWNSRPVKWTCEELASRLYVPPDHVLSLLRDLVRLQLITETEASPKKYAYHLRSAEQDRMMAELDRAYRSDIIRISRMIHSKASSAVREFARAFRFKKERD